MAESGLPAPCSHDGILYVYPVNDATVLYILFVKYIEKSPANSKPEAQIIKLFLLKSILGKFPLSEPVCNRSYHKQTLSSQRQWSPFCSQPLEAGCDLTASEMQQWAHTNHLQELSLGLKDGKGWEIPAELKSLSPKIGPATAGEPTPCPNLLGHTNRAT